MPSAKISYSQSKYKEVAANTTDSDGGAVIIDGETIAVTRVRLNGSSSDPVATALIAWDWGGASETIIASSEGDVDSIFDTTNTDLQFTGDGAKKLSVVLINDTAQTSPFIGGSFEATKIG